MGTDLTIWRREFIAAAGLGGFIGTAGCLGDSDDDEEDEPDEGKSLEDGTIRLEVISGESAEAIPDADVTLSGETLDEGLEERTDDDGEVRFEDLEIGEYEIETVAEGYDPYEEDEIELDDEYNASIDMTHVLQEENDEH